MTGKKRLKRSGAPGFLPIPRKKFKWTVKPLPGPHPAGEAIPLGILLREVLRLAENLREVKFILKQGHVRVDEKVVKDHRFPVGLMDVIEFMPLEKFYRMLPTAKRIVYPFEIAGTEKKIKLCKVNGKSILKEGLLQITLHDGRSAILGDETKLKKISLGDVILYNTEEKKIDDYIPMENGVLALITGGQRRGLTGVVQDTIHPKKMGPKIISVKLSSGEVIKTIEDYIFPIGREKPLIKLPNVESAER